MNSTGTRGGNPVKAGVALTCEVLGKPIIAHDERFRSTQRVSRTETPSIVRWEMFSYEIICGMDFKF